MVTDPNDEPCRCILVLRYLSKSRRSSSLHLRSRASVVTRSSRRPAPGEEPDEQQQHHTADERSEHAPEVESGHAAANAEAAEYPAADERPDDPDDEVAE